MDLCLELKDDYIKRFVDLYNRALKLDDEELIKSFHEVILYAIFESIVHSLEKVLNLK